MGDCRSFLLLSLTVLSPLLLCLCFGREEKPVSVSPVRASPQAVCVEEETQTMRDEAEMRLKTAEGVLTLRLADYLQGVVAAEMPASFSLEALKAQAVAARTDTLYRRQIGKNHADADCCDDPGCCKAYYSEAALRERWGADYDLWAARIRQAVTLTDGQVLLWEGKPIFAAFHSASDGATEDCENVWVQALPYLRSVSSPEKGETIPGFYETVRIGRNELQAAVSSAALGENPALWLTAAAYTPAGRLEQVTVGGVTLSGTAFRRAVGLRSSAVTWTADGDGLRLTTRGMGHGVGMSQYGAETMAENGADYREILLHYYTGVTLGYLSEEDL